MVSSTSSVMLPGLSRAHIGSPLLDIASFLMEEGGVLKLSPSDGAGMIEDLLKEYHGAFAATCGCLRTAAESLSLRWV